MNQAVAQLIRVGLLLTIFLVGWNFSLDLMGSEKFYYTKLTIISFLSGALILIALHGPVRQEIHLWIIFILFIIAYYIKFYMLCYFKLESSSNYLDIMNPVESELLDHPDVIINYYEMVTIVFFVFALLIAILIAVGNVSKIKSTVSKLFAPDVTVKPSTINWLVGIAIVSSLVLIYIQIMLGIGFVSAADQRAEPLPYRLAGIIMTIYKGIIPLLFLLSVWLADAIRSNYLVKITVGAYILFGVLAGLLSTSKASLLTVVVTLTILWLVTDTFTRKRFLLMMLIVPFMGFFNGFLSINRMMRSSNPDFGIFEIMGKTAGFLFSTDSIVMEYEEPIQQAVNYWGLLLRINGADSLINIINYAPVYSFDRVWHLLFVSPETIATLYAQDVHGLYYETGVAFSPSLLGYFYFVFGNIALVCFGMIFYTLIWHLLFRALLRSRLLIKPIVFSMLIVIVGLYTSEGTLESMPQSIAMIIVFAIFAEFIIRRLFNNSTLRSPRSKLRIRS